MSKIYTRYPLPRFKYNVNSDLSFSPQTLLRYSHSQLDNSNLLLDRKFHYLFNKRKENYSQEICEQIKLYRSIISLFVCVCVTKSSYTYIHISIVYYLLLAAKLSSYCSLWYTHRWLETQLQKISNQHSLTCYRWVVTHATQNVLLNTSSVFWDWVWNQYLTYYGVISCKADTTCGLPLPCTAV